ncbi:prolipoprotein diacylglyceryl transferase [Gemmatimonadota bacterium]
MHPELLHIGPLVLRSYGVLMATGFAVGAWWLVRRGTKRGMPAHRLIDLSIAMVVAGLAGGRMMYVLTHLGEFSSRPWLALWPFQPDGTFGLQGFVYYGGIITALPVAAWLLRRWGLSPLRVLDAGAPALALGTAFGRMGCFLNGCCFGRPSSGPFGMVFPEGSQAGAMFAATRIHPTQLYMVADNLLIVLALLAVDRRWGRFDGAVIGTYLILTGLTRGYEDLYRYYESGMRLFQAGGLVITVNQAIGPALVAAGVMLLVRSRRRTPDTPE